MELIFFWVDSKLAIQFQNFNATENVESYMSTIFETKWNHMKSTEIMVQNISLNIRQNLNHGLKFLKTKNTTKPETSKKSSQISAQKWPPTKSQSA